MGKFIKMGKFKMGSLNKDIFCYSDDDLDLYRNLMKSGTVVNSFDSCFAMFLKKQLGCSSSSSSSSSSDNSDDDDGGGSSGSDDSSSSDGEDGDDSCGNGENEGEDEDEDEGQADTHMKMFLEKLAVDGTSYVLKRDGKPDIKFEGMDEDEDEDDDEFCDFNENVVDQEELSGDSESEPRRRGKDLDVGSGATRDKGILRADGMGNLRNANKNGQIERRDKGVKNVGKKQIFEANEKDSLVEQVDSLGKVSHKKKRRLSEYISALDFDPEYKMFLDQCEMEGDSLVFVANGKRLKYGEDDNQSLSDSEVYVLDRAPDGIESNHAPTLNYNANMEEDDLQCLGSCNATENPQFRKEVMDVLRKPFNYKEYKRLLEDVRLRKPTERHVDMRSGNTSFQQATMGKSYLDHYADLKKQLDAFKNDKPKRLNILRGFFYYLKRMADDGKFKPWLDQSCMAIIPSTG